MQLTRRLDLCTEQVRMGAEKGSSKSGGIFHLFDWNRKSRKKLFSNGTVSPEGTKQGKKCEDSLPTSRLRTNDEDEIVGVSSIKGISDYSCASSVTDEEGNGSKAPGVVARLMGLDSMPTSSGLEPYATPVLDMGSLCDSNGIKGSPEFRMNSQFNRVRHRTDGFTMKPVEFRSQKMPSSPIERFQIEALPPRFAKSRGTHHKLFSPIKNPGLTSTKNAAQIMEAAAKILEPRRQSSSKSKASSFVSCSIPTKDCDPKEKSCERLLQLSRRPTESTDIRLSRGLQLNKTWNSAADIVISRASPYSHESSAGSTKSKGKSISLAIQAKVNVQRRESLSSSCRNTGVQKDNDECKLNQPFRSQPNSQKNKQQRKTSLNSASSVLRQNNQKQNCPLSRGKLASSKSFSQQGRKVMSGDASSGKQRSINKLSANSRVSHRKDVVEISDDASLSSTKDFPQKKRLIDRSFSNEKNAFVDNKFVNRHELDNQPNVVTDEHTTWNKNNKDSTDVVSFTFTSPLTEQSGRTQSSSDVVEKLNLNRSKNYYHFDAQSEKNSIDMKGKRSASIGLNVITGDALSHLLEQKLLEVTSKVEPSHNFIKVSSFTCSTVKEPQSSIFVRGDAGSGKSKGRSCKEKSGGVSCLSSKNSQVLGMRNNLHVEENGECSGSSNSQKEMDHQHRSPLSTLDLSFSTGSCHSPESSGSTDGSKMYSSSFAFTGNSNVLNISDMCQSKRIMSEELEYIRDILSATDKLSSCIINQASTTLDPLLFDRLQINRNRNKHENELADCCNRRLLFDCVKECLDLKCCIYFQAGYKSWAKGMMMITGKDLAMEFWDVITGWKSMGEWMVDDLVDNEMSTQLGTWLDFRIEAFETGVDTAEEVLSSLIDEMLSDICTRV
ncbi:uncharacterized protein [Typha latifolia]|uniref:uncharacterized protein n=1 Tax=Typha latifolia TaxID=4733 RepID=UPI003C2D7CAF